jgi:hypothetical protein
VVRSLLALMLLLALVGCAPSSSPPEPEVAQTEALVIPTGIRIPSLNVSGNVDPTGFQAGSREIAVPPLTRPELAAWFIYSPIPGKPGPSVILAHVNGNGRPGLFANLHKVKIGESVFVALSGGTVAEFEITRVERYPKDDFPTNYVYADVPDPEIRLITCGGAFDGESYVDNVVAYGRLISGG